MTKHISPVVTIFVISSFVILIAAIVVVGSGRFSKNHIGLFVFFKENLNGLKVGAPVKVRGVQIGSVAAIRLGLAPEEGRSRPGEELRLPVIIEIDRSQIIGRGGTAVALQEKGFDAMIKRGMRAQLKQESLLTGLLYVDLDFHPKTPIELAIEPDSGIYREIPTVPTNLEAIQQQLTQALQRFQAIDLECMTRSIMEAAESIKNIASSRSLKATLEELKVTVADLNQTVIAARIAFVNANDNIGPLVVHLQKNSYEANATMTEARQTFVALRSTLEPGPPRQST